MESIVFAAFCFFGSVATGQVLNGGGYTEPPSEPVLFTSFQEQLWDDL